MALLKGRCEEMGWDIIKEAELLGVKRASVKVRMVNMRQMSISKVWSEREHKDITIEEWERGKRDKYDAQEAALMDKIAKLVECEKGD